MNSILSDCFNPLAGIRYFLTRVFRYFFFSVTLALLRGGFNPLAGSRSLLSSEPSNHSTIHRSLEPTRI